MANTGSLITGGVRDDPPLLGKTMILRIIFENQTSGNLPMKRTHIAALLLGFTLTSAAGLANAQTPTSNNAQPTPMTMERAEFLKMFTYDTINDMWIMNPGMAPPVGIRSRAEVKAERDMFLSMNRYDNATSKWIPLTGTPRNMSTMTREEVRAETAAYLRTHRYDEQTSKWEARTTGGSQ